MKYHGEGVNAEFIDWIDLALEVMDYQVSHFSVSVYSVTQGKADASISSAPPANPLPTAPPPKSPARIRFFMSVGSRSVGSDFLLPSFEILSRGVTRTANSLTLI
jgi:hypothetical protein